MFKEYPKLKKLADKHGLESKEVAQEVGMILKKSFYQINAKKKFVDDELLKFACMHCNKCGKKIIADKIKNKKWDGYSYKYSCNCWEKNIRISSG